MVFNYIPSKYKMKVVIFTLQETVEEMCVNNCVHVHLYVFLCSVLCVHLWAQVYHLVCGGQKLMSTVFLDDFPLFFQNGSVTDPCLTDLAWQYGCQSPRITSCLCLPNCMKSQRGHHRLAFLCGCWGSEHKFLRLSKPFTNSGTSPASELKF